MKALHLVSFLLLVVGGVNWGLVGLGMLAVNDGMAWNVVNMIVGNWPMLEGLVYLLVGLSAVWILITHRKECSMCSAGSSM